LAIYKLTSSGTLCSDLRLRDQLRESAAAVPSNLTEGFGRFDPLDNARFVRIARASLLECQNHLDDAVDRGHIDEETRKITDALAEAAISEIGGWLDYLQSPEARQNADRIRQKRALRRRRRLERREEHDVRGEGTIPTVNPGTMNPGTMNPGTVNPGTVNPGTLNPGTVNPGTLNPGTVNPGTVNSGTVNSGTVNQEPRTSNLERNIEPRTPK
jgi:four helix bundle protein